MVTAMTRTATVAISVVLALCFASFALADDMDDARTTATSSGGAVLNNINSKSGIQTNLTNPVINSATPMKTLGGTTTFNAQVSCNSSNAFLNVSVLPGGTGDLGAVYVQQDTTFSGHVNYTYQVPFPVSGICANGVIACNPGTWANCGYYQWYADPKTFQVSLQYPTCANGGVYDTSKQVCYTNPGAGNSCAAPYGYNASDGRCEENMLSNGATSLGGCYCINNSCGNGLAIANMAEILGNLGGGAAGALSATNPNFAVSSVSVDAPDFQVSFYGQDASSCTTVGGGYGAAATPPQAYYSAPGLISGDAQTAATAEAANPNSMYSLVNTLAGETGSLNVVQCLITRSESTVPGSVACNASSDYPIQIRKVYRADGTAALWDQVGTSSTYSLTAGACVGMQLDISQLQQNIEGCIYSSGCNECANGLVSLVYDGTCPLASPNSGCDDTVNSWSSFPTCTGDNVAETITNQCTNVPSTCSLETEVVDGVSTITNYASTGLVPVSSCREYNGTFSHDICEPWWQKTDTYTCTGTGYDFTDFGQRVAYIQNSVTASGSNYTYNDETQNASGSWVQTTNNPLDMQSLTSYGSCESACEVKAPTANTQAGINMNITQNALPSTTATFNFYYRTCPDGVTCPVNAGETIMQNCQCLDQFANAAGVMQTLRMGGQDIVCSSGTPQPLGP
jgi:hypothetical protein